MLRENKSCFQHCDDTTYFFKPEYARLVRYSQCICGYILLFWGLGIIRYSQFTVDAYCYSRVCVLLLIFRISNAYISMVDWSKVFKSGVYIYTVYIYIFLSVQASFCMLSIFVIWTYNVPLMIWELVLI